MTGRAAPLDPAARAQLPQPELRPPTAGAPGVRRAIRVTRAGGSVRCGPYGRAVLRLYAIAATACLVTVAIGEAVIWALQRNGPSPGDLLEAERWHEAFHAAR